MIRRIFAVVFALLILVKPSPAQSLLEETDCLETPADFSASCGYMTLPQDYGNARSGALRIFYTRIASHSPDPKPDPLVYLVGGPGSSGSHLLMTSFERYLRPFAAERDIIVIDQRGTGMSQPSLYCGEAVDRRAEVTQSHHADYAELLLDILRECRDRLSRYAIRFEAFHSGSSALDVVNVLLALGYDEWNLVGVSYGSRLALEMMRSHPKRLRSVILDSVYPPQADIYLDVYFHGERAVRRVFAACAADEACDSRYPQLESTFYRLYHQLNRQPLRAPYKPPGQYRALEVEISGYRLYDWMFSWLYTVPGIAKVPRLISELRDGKADDALMYGMAYDGLTLSLSLGMHYTVQCQEEYISVKERDYASVIAAYPHLSGYLNYQVEGSATLRRLCDMWRAKARPQSANDPVRSHIPALLLSGEYDPITPPAYADMTRETLDSAFNFVLPHIGHGVLRSHECAVAIALAFIDAPTIEPDSGCINAMIPLEFE